ncbi:unnamed protein product [Eruca vesicaria subsp. sativa]|uniref:No apical meristem-associated C-terminal domain-containing protein n=1 Tax=Eruca vesicaria subsp. sativa TaxID=29727 RepID=A0ABC8KD83_ERUVS|nr:unnamed protein product [Eruca vesicaria subsp. sativa]
MEIASTSTNLNMRPTYQRYDIGCRSTRSSLLHINPNFRRDGCDVVMAAGPKKRKHCDEENPPEKRQKKTVEALKSSRFTEPVDAKPNTKPVQSLTTLHVTETAKSKVVSTTKPGGEKTDNQDHSFKDLIAKAREKLQEKRQIDQRSTDIASQRIAARLALNRVVKTVDFDDHLEYHLELEKLGCDFISDQVSCLNKFDLLTRSDYYYYIDESNS